MKAYLLTSADGEGFGPDYEPAAKPELWVGLDPSSALWAWRKSNGPEDPPAWPLRLFEGETLDYRPPRRRSARNQPCIATVPYFDVAAEIPAHRICGRYGAQVFGFIDRLRALSEEDWYRIAAAPLGNERARDPMGYSLDLLGEYFAIRAKLGRHGIHVARTAEILAQSRTGTLANARVAWRDSHPFVWIAIRQNEMSLAAAALAFPDRFPPSLFERALEPFARVMGDGWFRSPSRVPALAWPHGPVVEPPSSFPENGLAP